MKTKLFIIPSLLLSILIMPSCGAKEDGDINEWVGTYEWSYNHVQHWHRYIMAKDDRLIKEEDLPKANVNLEIRDDKMWYLPDPKGPGNSGQIRCYKDHINLLGLSIDYAINEKFDFKLVLEESTGRTFLQYYKDGSEGRSRDKNFDYDIRSVRFWLK